jgi:hypothetical protein
LDNFQIKSQTGRLYYTNSNEDAEVKMYTYEEQRGDWRKLHNGELHNLYASPQIIKMIK